MVPSRIFGFVTITVCLVACMCAHADVSYREVSPLATKAEDMSTKLLKRAKDNAESALEVLESIKSYKQSSEQAVPEANEKAKGNREAEAFAHKAKKALDDIVEEYANVISSAQKNVEQTNTIVEKAGKLYYKAQYDIYSGLDALDDFTIAKKNALEVIEELKVFDSEITAASVSYEVTQSAEERMSSHAKTVELAKYQIDGIVAFGKIENMLKDAETGIQQTQKKKNEVNVIIQAIKKLDQQTQAEVKEKIDSLSSSVDTYFRSASSAADDAQKTNTFIQTLKRDANDILARIKAATDVNEAKQLCESSDSYAAQASQHLSQIQEILASATTSATSTQSLYDEAAKELKNKGIHVEQLMMNTLPVDETGVSGEVHKECSQRRVDGDFPSESRSLHNTKEEQTASKGGAVRW